MIYDILTEFKAAPDGAFVTTYRAGTRAELTEPLAEYALKMGWVRAPGQIENKAIVSDGKPSFTSRLTGRRK
jgi:hypothetical protein